jgi:hypothetical protein
VIDRRTFLAGTGGVLLAAPLAAEAQPSGKVYRVGMLLPGGLSIRNSAFHQELREWGYVQGQNLILEERSAEYHYERLPGLAIELVQAHVDIIFASTSQSARAAQQATRPRAKGKAIAAETRVAQAHHDMVIACEDPEAHGTLVDRVLLTQGVVEGIGMCVEFRQERVEERLSNRHGNFSSDPAMRPWV